MNTMTLEKIEQEVAQLSVQDQLRLLSRLAGQLSDLPLVTLAGNAEGLTRLAELDAWLAECDAVAESIEGEFDAVEDLRQIREERANIEG